MFGDMPIYIALDCADAWAHPEMLLIDRDGRPSHVAGVPPDYFSEDGQLWGNPLYDWDYHERGSCYFAEEVRKTVVGFLIVNPQLYLSRIACHSLHKKRVDGCQVSGVRQENTAK